MALTVLSAWIAFVAWRERRRWLLTWSSIYGAVAVFMTLLTYIKVPYCLSLGTARVSAKRYATVALARRRPTAVVVRINMQHPSLYRANPDCQRLVVLMRGF